MILLDDMRCTGNETDILDCPHDPNTGDCSHFEDAGVRCRVDGGQRLIVQAHTHTRTHTVTYSMQK